MNGYVPLNDSKTFTQAHPNGSGAGFAGNQVFVNTDQTLVEEALPGADLEIGYRLKFLDGITDATRIYGGGYHFEGDQAEDVSGFRTRFTSDITQDVQIGARYQHDDERGSQTYLEATVRFPMGFKKSFRKDGLYARLDESPERDIDIVSNEAVVDAGITNTTLLNAQTGLAQNIIHVDNTNGVATGTAEDPFNTLAAAEAAAGVNDMIYVHRGDGTTTGMNAGITLDDAGQMLAGSGADLTFSRKRFRTAGNHNISGAIVNASQAPVITNTVSHGIYVNADNVFVSGLTVDGANDRGVLVEDSDNIFISNVISQNNDSRGFDIDIDAIAIDSVTVSNSQSIDNGGRGFYLELQNGASVQSANFKHNISTGNEGRGYFVEVTDGGFAENISFSNNLSDGNGGNGFRVEARDTGSYYNVSFMNNVSMNNPSSGYQVFLGNDAAFSTAFFQGNRSVSNGSYGFTINNDSVTGRLLADLGGGLLGSSGGNSAFDSALDDLLVDLNGEELMARRNWWGTSEGLTDDRVHFTLESTVDASNPLLFDPFQ